MLYQPLTGVFRRPALKVMNRVTHRAARASVEDLLIMTVTQNLADWLEDQVEEALSPIAELLPPLLKGMTYRSFPAPVFVILRLRWHI